MTNTAYRKPLPGTTLEYFDARAAVNDLQPGAWEKLPYTARVHAENIVRRADPAIIADCLKQIIEVKRELDFRGFRPVSCVTTFWVRPRWSTSRACAMRLPIRAVIRPR